MENQLRLVFLLIVCGFAASLSIAQVAPPAQIPISVTINAPSSEVKAGSDLRLDVVMSNTSDDQVGLTTWPEDFRVDVFDSNG
ncbi:MAG TPA: hypothetical protein VFF50_14195, partial [Candidatus Deferrimicrobiaceae bacterium]|nr:hypothetical protein [Candidatus Deferrimicrobiaceae bacterium]